MRRWHEEHAIALRAWRFHRRFVHENLPTDRRCDDEVGRFRKGRAFGCGRPRCQVCHFEKVHGIKSHQERVADRDFQEQLRGDD